MMLLRTTRPIVSAAAVAGLAASPFVESAATDVAIPEHDGSALVQTTKVATSSERTEGTCIGNYSEPPAEWTKAMALRFRELARKEATGELSSEEAVELERLTHDRRRLQHSRTVEEVLWEAKQREVTSKLLEALREYVEFHETADRPGSCSG